MRVQTAALDQLAAEASQLAGEVRRCHELNAGRAWPESRDHALSSLRHFHRQLRSIGMRRTELVGSGL
jgi:hypothetical protein